MMLADTSVWIAHFRKSDDIFVRFLNEGYVYTHPLTIGELACGSLKRRAETLKYLKALPGSIVAHDEEVLTFIDVHALMSKGLGYIDIHLLCSAKLSNLKLWTLDKKLHDQAMQLDIAFNP